MRSTAVLKRRLTIGLAGLVVAYCVVVIGFVSTSPDLRLRCLLVDGSDVGTPGIQIQAVPHLTDESCLGPQPHSGDRLLKIGDRETNTFLDFTESLTQLRTAKLLPGASLPKDANPYVLADTFSLPSLVEVGGVGRFVRVQYLPAGSVHRETCWLMVQTLPLSEIVMSLVWFVLQFGMFAVGAVVYWHRPFDLAARQFFIMCVVTLGAFVAGYHWWVVAGNLWLSIPFVICALLVPVVTLHFFLVFLAEQPNAPAVSRPITWGLYVAPVVFGIAILGLIAAGNVLQWGEQTPAMVLRARTLSQWQHVAIFSYFGLAAVYFLLTLAQLFFRHRGSKRPIERNQVRWMLWAAMFATIPVGYTLYLACFDRVSFALGRGGVPMFLASLSFVLAYGISILRHRMMLVDEVVSKGFRFYVATATATLLVALAITTTSLLIAKLNVSPAPVQTIAIFSILLITTTGLLWARDRVQRVVDRQFFREKYQLDKALQRMNQAVGHLADRQTLAERMLTSCCDVLQVSRAAMYLNDKDLRSFHLLASVGQDFEPPPVQFNVSPEVMDVLRSDTAIQKIPTNTGNTISPAQQFLRTIRADLVHAISPDDTVAALVVLGPRLTGGGYTAEDVTFLHAMTQITSVALHYARVHHELAELNEELGLKVDKIATQQRQIAMLQAELHAIHPAREQRTASDFERGDIKGNSPAIQHILSTARKVAGSDATVLVRGESGTGKELLAQLLHENSPRREGPLVRVHCAALSPQLLESELFGHAKGAFTGAHSDRVGRFEMANGGTLFLDEIGDISLDVQVKLLRVLQTRQFEPVGDSRTIPVDVRVVTATHQNLERLITEGRFREDLYYRLNVISITLPPLRERREDLFELASHFLLCASQRTGKRILQFDDEALDVLEQYDWPGNIRELENTVERAVVLAEGARITLHDLPAELVSPETRGRHLAWSSNSIALAQSLPERETVTTEAAPPRGPVLSSGQDERETLLAALRACDGNKAEAARKLGMPRSTYYSKLKKYSLA